MAGAVSSTENSGYRESVVNELKDELASLRLDNEPPPSRKGLWIALTVVVVVVVGAALAWRARTAFASTEVEVAQATLEQSGTGGQAGTPLLTASGYVVARRKAVVSAKIQGRLAELRVEEGSRVREGEILARLESQDYEAQVARSRAQVQQAQAQIAAAQAAMRRAEADLTEARRQVGVNERLTTEQILPKDTLDASRSRVSVLDAAIGQARADEQRASAGLAQASADLAFTQAQLQNTVIRAPFSGVVVKKMAEVGESVAPIPPGVNLSTSSGAVVALADLDTLEVEVDVAEANVAKLTDRQLAEVTVEAFPEKRYKAELRQVIPTADRTKATVMVKVTILDKDPDLKPEMSAKATFLEAPQAAADPSAPAKATVLVPQTTIVTRDGKSHVFEVVDGTAKLVGITTGPTRQDRVVVTGGLVGSETLVANPPEGLKDGDRVSPRR
jgi:RND family efflux transporter MFP subunit